MTALAVVLRSYKTEIEVLSRMRSSTLVTLLIVLAVVCVGLAIYYLIPGINHPFTFSASKSSHKTHALAFFVIALCSVLGARFVRSSAQR